MLKMSIERLNIMNYRFKTKPYQHQLNALALSWERPYFAYFMEMGTGKSKVLIDNIAMLYDKGKINGALIIAPKGVIGTWYKDQIPGHMPDHVEYKAVMWQANINIKQQKKLDTLFETGEDLHILVMNVESFSTKKGIEFAYKFLSCHNTMMTIDESTTIKNPDAKRTKNICKLGPHAKYRRILTGSPITKSPLDLYKQCDFLAPELLGHSSYYSFRTRYAIMKTANFGGRSVQIVVGYRNLPELTDMLKAFSYRVLKDECLDLPKKTFMKRVVKLTKEQEHAYKQMSQLALAQFQGKLMTTATVMTQLMRLHQITCGHFTADDGTIKDLKNNRTDELSDLLNEVHGKVVIWAHYQYDVETIVERIKKEHGNNSVVTYYGLTPQDQRQDNIKKFQDKEGPVKFLVGTTATGGYGITLTAASTMIYYSNGYDLEKRQQSEARIDRIGQESPMTYIDLIAENTIDDKIVVALRKKVNIASQIMGEELKDWI